MATVKVPKQTILHVRIERDLIKEIDRHAKQSKCTRSVAVRQIIKAWADGR